MHLDSSTDAIRTTAFAGNTHPAGQIVLDAGLTAAAPLSAQFGDAMADSITVSMTIWVA
jgi:hypothetical protein